MLLSAGLPWRKCYGLPSLCPTIVFSPRFLSSTLLSEMLWDPSLSDGGKKRAVVFRLEDASSVQIAQSSNMRCEFPSLHSGGKGNPLVLIALGMGVKMYIAPNLCAPRWPCWFPKISLVCPPKCWSISFKFCAWISHTAPNNLPKL